MSKALQDKINELFEATKDLRSFEEIKPYCDRFNEWIKTHTSYSNDSLGSKLSSYGFYKKFKSIKLEQGKNADTIPKHDKEGNVIGTELKHYVAIYCGLTKDQWELRNATTRSTDRIDESSLNPKVISPEAYLNVVGKLLSSSDPHELAVGIIAATGRRPVEVIARGKLTPIEGKPYHALFSGQVKKRGADLSAFEIATLFPAKSVIEAWSKLRRDEGTKSLVKEVAIAYPKSITRQNIEIGNRRNGSLLRVVREYFGDKGDKTPVLPFRYGDEQDNSKALRAAYASLATERDCKGAIGAKILHASRLLGHMIRVKKDDRNLIALGTSIGYLEYSVAGDVPFPTIPEREKTHSIRVNESDFETIKSLQERWQLPNQQRVVSQLIERHELCVELGKKLQDYQAKNTELARVNRKMIKQLEQLQTRINQLEQEKPEMSQVKPLSQENAASETHEAKIERLIEEKLTKVLSGLAIAQPTQTTQPAQPAQPTQPGVVKKQEVVDWSGMSNGDLWSTKVKGASDEKIRRSFNAVCLYNDTIATGDDDRLAITNQALRELSGVNGLLVGDWLKAHTDEVISHNSKYGMQNSKDPQRLDTYYNKRHGAEKVSKILRLVNEQCLDGEAFRSQK